MSNAARLIQRSLPVQQLDRTTTITRAGVSVPFDGETVLYTQGGVIFVNGKYTLTGTIPTTGRWEVNVPSLAGLGEQFIGRIGYRDALDVQGRSSNAYLTNTGTIVDAYADPVQPRIQFGSVTASPSAANSYTATVNFPSNWGTGVSPNVYTQVNSAAGAAIGSTILVYSITNTQFTYQIHYTASVTTSTTIFWMGVATTDQGLWQPDAGATLSIHGTVN